MGTLKKFFDDNGLSIALFSLFIVCIAGQGATGFFAYSQALHDNKLPAVGFLSYLGTGTFLDGMFSNWQAAVLQLAVLIIFSAVLRQRGAAHSRKALGEMRDPKPKGEERKDAEQARQDFKSRSWAYRNSLGLAFFATFAILFVAHAWFGWKFYNETEALEHSSPIALAAYLGSAAFWFSLFQTWEAEFLAIGFYVMLSIFLRQENSSESKRTDACDDETGETNE